MTAAEKLIGKWKDRKRGPLDSDGLAAIVADAAKLAQMCEVLREQVRCDKHNYRGVCHKYDQCEQCQALAECEKIAEPDTRRPKPSSCGTPRCEH